MGENDRPSVHDWPAMAKDLIDRASQSPHYADSTHPAVMGGFASEEEGLPLIIVSCTMDIHEEGFKILHISFSFLGGSPTKMDASLQKIDDIVQLFNENSPYFYEGKDGHLNFCWPSPWENEMGHKYLKERTV